VFTTLRVSDGALFAWERHWARMSRDARLVHVAMPESAAEVEAGLLRLIEANGHPDCTLRLVVVRNGGGMWEGQLPGGSRASDVIALTADSKKWGESVRLAIQPHARFAANEFAGAKILSWAENLTWAERAHRAGFDETILLNEHGKVAECTSANIFAVLGDDVYTPPLSLDDLYHADEVFITSTTRDLLPVREIAGRPAGRSTSVRERLVLAFREFVARDIAGRRLALVSR
jgi:branched-chain amino acid aminotransferase